MENYYAGVLTGVLDSSVHTLPFAARASVDAARSMWGGMPAVIGDGGCCGASARRSPTTSDALPDGAPRGAGRPPPLSAMRRLRVIWPEMTGADARRCAPAGESTRTKLSPRTVVLETSTREWHRVWLSDAMQMAVARSTCTCG